MDLRRIQELCLLLAPLGVPAIALSQQAASPTWQHAPRTASASITQETKTSSELFRTLADDRDAKLEKLNNEYPAILQEMSRECDTDNLDDLGKKWNGLIKDRFTSDIDYHTRWMQKEQGDLDELTKHSTRNSYTMSAPAADYQTELTSIQTENESLKKDYDLHHDEDTLRIINTNNDRIRAVNEIIRQENTLVSLVQRSKGTVDKIHDLYEHRIWLEKDTLARLDLAKNIWLKTVELKTNSFMLTCSEKSTPNSSENLFPPDSLTNPVPARTSKDPK